MTGAAHFWVFHCTFAASDAAGQTQQRTYRPGSVPVPAVGQQPPTAVADPATMGQPPPSPETDGGKPDRILGSPRPKALAEFCPVETAPSLPREPRTGPNGTDDNLLRVWWWATNRQNLRWINCCCLDFHTSSRTNNEAIIEWGYYSCCFFFFSEFPPCSSARLFPSLIGTSSVPGAHFFTLPGSLSD